MDQEIPRTEGSISNRGALAKAVGVEKLMKKNKVMANVVGIGLWGGFVMVPLILGRTLLGTLLRPYLFFVVTTFKVPLLLYAHTQI